MRTLADLVPLRTGACRDAVDAVSAIAAGEQAADPVATAHVTQCLRCQAEVVAFRKVLRVMANMREDPVATPFVPLPLTGAGVGARVGAAGSGPSPRALRVAYLGGLTAAGAAGMVVWLSHHRHLLSAG